MFGRGVSSLGGAIIIGRILQIIAALVLIKQLSPYQMGVVGLLTAVFVGAYSLTNLGFDRYLVHADNEKVETASIYDNIWTLQIIRGVLVLTVCYILSIVIPALSDFSEAVSSQLIWIGVALLINNLSNPYFVKFERYGNFNYLAICKGLSVSLSSLFMIVMIQFVSDPWVYVAGQLVNTSIYTVLTYALTNTKPSIKFDFYVTKDVLAYCKHLLLIATVSFIAFQFENYYIGFAFGVEALGYYFTWGRIIFLPREIIAQFVDKILFTKACSSRRSGEPIAREHLILLIISLALLIPFYFFTWYYGEWMISIIAGEEWVEYLWVGKYFIFIGGVQLVALLYSPLVLSMYPKLSSIIRTCEAALLVFLMMLLGGTYGIEGVLIASISVSIIACCTRIYISYRYILSDDWRWHVKRFISFVVLLLIYLWVSESVFGGINGIPGRDILVNYILYYLLTVYVGYKTFRHVRVQGQS